MLIGGASGTNIYQSFYPDNTTRELGISTRRWGKFWGIDADLLGNLTVSGTVKTGVYTVATLPTPSAGMRAYVTDASATTYMSTVAGGGANVVPVFYDGTNWKIA